MAEYEFEMTDTHADPVRVEVDGETVDVRVTEVDRNVWMILTPRQSKRLRKALRRAEKTAKANRAES